MGVYEITTEPGNLESVKNALKDKNIPVENNIITMLPKNFVKVEDESKARQIFRLINTIEDNDDVQNVYTNADIPASVLEGEV